MARTVKDARLDSRATRERLQARKKPHYRLIETGRHIGYYRGRNGGSWLARALVDGSYIQKALGAADDVRDANGRDVLSFNQAQVAARDWFDQVAHAEEGVPSGPYTVAQACNDYLRAYQRHGKDETNTRARLERIKAALGDIELAKLRTKQIQDWHAELAAGGAMTRSNAIDEATGKRRVRALDTRDDDAMRRRKASANRLLTVLKAALNNAFHHPPEGVRVASRAAWEAAEPYRAADAPKISYLTDQEAVRLLNACEPDFRDIVAAALLTGCRYGELCRLKVRDFDAAAMALRVEISKAGKSRSIAVTDEGVAHFSRLAKGRAPGALLLLRSDGTAWLPSHQIRRMADTCAAAKIAPVVSFHVLRHTYGSRLAMRGAPMAVIAAQLGHSDTRMTERHYAHLGPSYVADTVRALFGQVGLPPIADNVVELGSAKSVAAGPAR